MSLKKLVRYWIPLFIVFVFALLVSNPAMAQELRSLGEIFEIPEQIYRQFDGKLPAGYTVDEVVHRAPEWPNPFLALLPEGAEPDFNYWRSRALIENALRARPETPSRLTIDFVEIEPNNSAVDANPIQGLGTGPGADSVADITGSMSDGDADFFAIDLAVGDIVGLALTDATRVTLWDPSGNERMGSAQNVSMYYPQVTALPRDGDAISAYVAEQAGTWFVSVSGGKGAYNLKVQLLTNSGCQKIYLDFDGPTVDPSTWGGEPGNVKVSPMADFLDNWGLLPTTENLLIDAVVANVEENLREDMLASGNNPLFDLQILNSRDNPGAFGAPDVSRVIIGGTIAELGLPTIGIAQAIDPGNFARALDSIVLLDLLSAPPFSPSSLNQFGLGANGTKLQLVATGVGNIAAHEAGHLLGNSHTENTITPPNIQDRGGNMANKVGVGADNTFGTADDIDVDFGLDQFSPAEGFTGDQDTLSAIELTNGECSGIFADGFESGGLRLWSSSVP